MTAVEASSKWGFGRSTILAWCKDGLIDGAMKKRPRQGVYGRFQTTPNVRREKEKGQRLPAKVVISIR